MPQGLQIYDASGNAILDITDRITTILGEINLSAATYGATNVSNATFALGTPWYFVITYDTNTVLTYDFNVSISGTTLTYSGDTPACKIIYGVY